MSNFHIKPAPGKSVRDPRTMRLLAAKGEKKPRNTYWLRRAEAGDVLVIEKAKPKGGAK